MRLRRAFISIAAVPVAVALTLLTAPGVPAATGTAPVVTTTAATAVTGTSATLNGTVNPGGLATTVWFQWGPAAKYTSTTASVQIPAGKTVIPVSITITGLSPNTAYRFQTVAKNAKATKYAGPSTFTPPTVLNVRPLNNDASAGKVVFTFDDGPSGTTSQLVAMLSALHVPAEFFDIGVNAQNNPAGVRSQLTAGSVQNHTYDHASMTGDSTPGTGALTDAQATAELTKANQAIVAAGAPQPTLWRPPYGDINSHYNTLANGLGLRLVMPYGDPVSGNVVDSNDWQGLTASQIVTDVTQGYTSNWYTGAAFFHGIQADSIIALHDDGNQSTIASLQGIVDYMNAHHLGATAAVRPDATGGVLAFTNGVSNNATSVNGQALRVKKLGRQE